MVDPDDLFPVEAPDAEAPKPTRAKPKVVALPAPPPDLNELVPFGLGWRWRWRTGEDRVQIVFRGLKQTPTGPVAEAEISARLPGVGIDGVLTAERVNLADGRGRSGLANRMTERTGDTVNWRNLLDGICSRLLAQARARREVIRVGQMPRRPTRWLVTGLIEEGQTTSLFASGGAGKSFLALAVAISLVTGREIIPGWAPTRTGVPIYLDWETDADTINERVQQICAGAGIPPVEIDYLFCDAPLIDLTESLLEYTADRGTDLIIVDSVEAALMGTRSQGGDVHEPMGKANQLLRRLGMSGLLIDHVNAIAAQAEGLAGKAFGSIFKTNWVRIAYEVKPAPETADGKRHLGLFNQKRNNGRVFPPMGLAWSITEDASVWEAEDITEPALQVALPVRRRMELALADEDGLSIERLAEKIEAKAQAVRVELSRDRGRRFARNGNVIRLALPSLLLGTPTDGQTEETGPSYYQETLVPPEDLDALDDQRFGYDDVDEGE